MLTLAITGFDADPTTVTEIIGIKPTALSHRGVISLPGRRPRKYNGWFHDVHPEPIFDRGDYDRGLRAIVALLSGREDRFARLREEVRPDTVGIQGGFYLKADEQAGIWLDVRDMRLLADCEVEFGLELFIEEQP